jgi:hypothetical protein
MKRETVKALLENGILQAYAEGKEIQYDGVLLESCKFDGNPDDYSIKSTPPFKVGDFVRTKNDTVCKVKEYLRDETYGVTPLDRDFSLCFRVKDLTPVREVRTPLTFEQAVKLVAEKGFTLTNGACSFDVLCLGKLVVTLLCRETGETSTERYECFRNSLTFLDNTPFANVTYEDVT